MSPSYNSNRAIIVSKIQVTASMVFNYGMDDTFNILAKQKTMDLK